MLETITNRIGMELVLIPPGSFRMGGDKKLEQAEDHETPRHRVNISKTFYMGKYAVTQRFHGMMCKGLSKSSTKKKKQIYIVFPSRLNGNMQQEQTQKAPIFFASISTH